MTRFSWETLLAVEGIAEEVHARIRSDRNIFRFKMLPLIALRPGHLWSRVPPEGLRLIVFTKTSYALAWAINRSLLEASHLSRTWAPNGNRWALSLDEPPPFIAMDDKNRIQTLARREEVRVAHPVALALSLQLRQGSEMTDDHVLSIATQVAANSIPVLVAAGNWGAFGEGTLSPLARLPWTIAVGATLDSEGKQLHPASSIGKSGSGPEDGVTVVAHGENSFAPGEFGTSFAVPRVVNCLMLLTSFILQLRLEQEELATGRLGGVPLLHWMSVDTGFDGFNPRPSLPLPMIPQLGINRESTKAVLAVLSDAGLIFPIEPYPPVIKRMLIACAEPVSGYQSHEVGYGFVSPVTTINYLTQFTGLDLACLFIDEVSLSDSLRKELSSYKLANDDELGLLHEIATRSSLAYSIDYYTGEIHASMRDPGIDPRETGFRKNPRSCSWPPALHPLAAGADG